jgi:hypothetical protein
MTKEILCLIRHICNSTGTILPAAKVIKSKMLGDTAATIYLITKHHCRSRRSVVGIVTAYGLDD